MARYLAAMRIKFSATRRVWPGDTVELADGPQTTALLALGAVRPLPEQAPAEAFALVPAPVPAEAAPEPKPARAPRARKPRAST